MPGDGAGGGPDGGRVVYRNRDSRIDTLVPVVISDVFIRTRSANAFNWGALDVGSGIQTIRVKERLEAEVVVAGNAHPSRPAARL
jgi:hypothetical protein